MTRPNHVFQRRDGRNEPWVQSWKTMKVRTRNPPAGMDSARTRRYETSSSEYIATHSSRKGTTDVARSIRAGRSSGRA